MKQAALNIPLCIKLLFHPSMKRLTVSHINMIRVSGKYRVRMKRCKHEWQGDHDGLMRTFTSGLIILI